MYLNLYILINSALDRFNLAAVFVVKSVLVSRILNTSSHFDLWTVELGQGSFSGRLRVFTKSIDG